MTAMTPFTQFYNTSHMYDFVDLRSNTTPKLCEHPDSLMYYLSNHPHLTKFAKLVNTAQMNGQLSDPQSNFTILATPDEYFPDNVDLDTGNARQILASATLNKRIDGNLLRSSPVSYYTTRNPRNRLYVTNINDVTELNLSATVLQFDIKVGNGVIHLINNLLLPNNNTYIN